MNQLKFILLPFFIMGLVGCDAKVKQCNDLIAVINQTQSIMTKANGLTPGKAGPKDFIAVADDLDKHKDKIGAVKLKDEKLKGFSKEYQNLLAELAKVYRELAQSLESKDRDAQLKVSKNHATVLESQKPIVEKINSYCSSK